MNQNELKEWITKDMQEMGYKLVPPFESIEVVDCREYDIEKKKAYYQNISKLALEIEFDKAMKGIN